jgi:HK97 family phage major capsid protein
VDFLTQLRDKVAAKINERHALEADLDKVLETPTAEKRDLNDAEAKQFADMRSKIAAIDLELDGTDSDGTDSDGMVARVKQLEDETRIREARDEQLKKLGVSAGGATTKRAEAVYRPDGEASFFADQFNAQTRNDRNAQERLGRYEAELRDVIGSAFTGAIPPQYLVEQFAAVVRAGSPFWNALNHSPLPPTGLSLVVPRGTTGSLGAATTEGAGFSEQDVVNVDDTITVNLFSAQQDVSRAIFQRGGAVVDQIIFPDLISAYFTALDSSLINGSGTAPAHRGVRNVSGISAVTYTTGPSVVTLWPKLQDAIQRINALRFAGATLVLMHPRRWGWLLAGVDSSNRPVFEAAAQIPQNAMGIGDVAKYGQVVGAINGQVPVVTDANIPTNLGGGTEDVIIVMRTYDFLALEEGDGMPTQFTFEQSLSTAPGQVRLAVGGFTAFHAGRYPTGISTITGSSLATPTF